MDRLRQRVSELSQQVERQQQTLDELSSRMALLAGQGASASRPRPAPRKAAVRPVARRTPPRPAVVDPPEDPATARVRRRLPVVKFRQGEVSSPGRRRGGAAPRGGARPTVLRLTGAPDLPAARPGSGRSPSAIPPGGGDRIPVVPLPDGPVNAPKVSGPAQEYQAARRLLAQRKLADAARAFSQVARRYPRHDLADNATYWLAESLFQQGQHRRAAWVLRSLLKRYPSGNKAPAALIKLSLCEQRLGRRAEARKVLAQVVQLYPKSREAAEAARLLKRFR